MPLLLEAITARSRFSTVVHGRAFPMTSGTNDDLRMSSLATAGPVEPEITGLNFSEQPPHTLPFSNTSLNDLELLILSNRPASPVPLAASVPNLSATDDTPAGRSATPSLTSQEGWELPAVATNECDPPLLTDGRGRVVWSTTPASRRGRGRAGSSTLPAAQQHKVRLREESLGSEAQDSHSDQTCSPRITRARSFPEAIAAANATSATVSLSLPSLNSPPASTSSYPHPVDLDSLFSSSA